MQDIPNSLKYNIQKYAVGSDLLNLADFIFLLDSTYKEIRC